MLNTNLIIYGAIDDLNPGDFVVRNEEAPGRKTLIKKPQLSGFFTASHLLRL